MQPHSQNAASAKQASGACNASQHPADRLIVSIKNAVVLLNIRLPKLGAISIRFTAAVVAYSQHFGQSAVRQVEQRCKRYNIGAGNAQANNQANQDLASAASSDRVTRP